FLDGAHRRSERAEWLRAPGGGSISLERHLRARSGLSMRVPRRADGAAPAGDFRPVRPDAGSDQAFLVEEGLAPAHHLDAGEQAGLGERVVLDEALGLGAVLGVDDDDAAVAALALVVDLRARGEQLVLVGGEILEMRPAHLVAQLQTVRL